MGEMRTQYQYLLDSAADVIAHADANGALKYISPAVYSVLGYHPEELAGMQSINLCHSKDIVTIQEEFSEVMRGKDSARFVARVCHKKGYYVWLEMTVAMVRGPRRQDVSYVIVGRDITEQRKTSERLMQAVRMAGLGHWEWDVITDEVIWSESLYLMHGISSSVFPSLTSQSIIEWIHPEDRDQVAQELYRCIESGASYDDEWRIIRKDGKLRFLHAVGEVDRDPSGAPFRMMGTVQDVTDSKLAEITLRRHVYELDKAQQLAHLGSWDREVRTGVWHWSNETYRIFGWVLQSGVDAARFLQSVHSEDRDRVREAMMTIDQGVAYDMKYRIIRSSGEVRMVRSLGDAEWENGQVRRVFGVIQDITEHEAAQKSLRDSEELLRRTEKLSVVGQLAAGLAHEIRNPLTALKGFTQLCIHSLTGRESRYLEIMQGELDRIEGIVNELLVLAKPQTMTYSSVDMRTILYEVGELLSGQASLYNVRILHEFQEIPRLRVEPGQIKQVCINVMKNAIEAMPNGGLVTVRLRIEEGVVAIEIADEGEGMPHEIVSRLGEPFYTTKEGGTGLGLLVSQQIMTHHGGTLNIESQVGHGTCVCLRLPTTELPIQSVAEAEKRHEWLGGQ